MGGLCRVVRMIQRRCGSSFFNVYFVINQMEDELVCSKDSYLLAIDIYKILSLLPENRVKPSASNAFIDRKDMSVPIDDCSRHYRRFHTVIIL